MQIFTSTCLQIHEETLQFVYPQEMNNKYKADQITCKAVLIGCVNEPWIGCVNEPKNIQWTKKYSVNFRQKTSKYNEKFTVLQVAVVGNFVRKDPECLTFPTNSGAVN